MYKYLQLLFITLSIFYAENLVGAPLNGKVQEQVEKSLDETSNDCYVSKSFDENNIAEVLDSVRAYIITGNYEQANFYAQMALRNTNDLEKQASYKELVSLIPLINLALENKGIDNSQQFPVETRDSLGSDTTKEIFTIADRNSEGVIGRIRTIMQAKRRTIILGIIGLVLLFIGLTWLLFNRLRFQSRVQRMKTAQIVNELERNRKSLYLQTLHMIRLNNGITDLESQLNGIKPGVNGSSSYELQKVLNTLRINKGLEKEWDNFNYFFKNIHSEFVEYMRSEYPDLTLGELRLCALLKLNLSNAEIASIMNIETKSVRMSKYRLKKKLSLPNNKEVSEFIHEIDIEVNV